MSASPSSGEPRLLRCPQCGAPLDAPAFALTTRCRYCGHTVKLAEPADPRPVHPLPSTAPSSGALIPIVVGAVALVGFAVAFVAYRASRPTSESAATPNSRAALESAAPSSVPARQSPEKAAEVRYAMSSLLAVSTVVDIDASRVHLLKLFPTVGTNRHGDELRYVVPLRHRWFSEVELGWKNESAGKLTSVAFRPPAGVEKFENQPEIADCLTKGLGKPEVRETDHLAGERSYFWGRHFPKAWADLYSSYLWLSFQNPEGVAPVTFAVVVRTLDGCP